MPSPSPKGGVNKQAYKQSQSRYRITNFHHHALPSIQKNIDLPYLATPGSDGRRKKCINGRSHATIYSLSLCFSGFISSQVSRYATIFFSSSSLLIIFFFLFYHSPHVIRHSQFTRKRNILFPHFHPVPCLFIPFVMQQPHPLSIHDEFQCSVVQVVQVIKTLTLFTASTFMTHLCLSML